MDDFLNNFKSFPFCPCVTQGLVSGVTSHFLTKHLVFILKILENITFSIFPNFLASYYCSHSFFVFVCCVKSYVMRSQQNVSCPNQNLDKNLEKLQFWPREAGTLKSQKILNSCILFEIKID